MNTKTNNLLSKWLPRLVVAGVVIGLVASYSFWWPKLSSWVDQSIASNRSKTSEEGHGHNHGGDGHGEEAHSGDDHGHDHGHEHDAASTLELTPQAMMNLGLTSETLKPIELTDYRRTMTVPAMVVARPGRTQIKVSTPLTGVVTHVHAVTGETILPGSLLFEIRLTHEDLVQTQTQFLQTLGELEVENREITRLEDVTASGAIPAKTLLERRYAKEKLEALFGAQREALKLHGLSERQIDEIVKTRQLLRDLTIVAPSIDEHEHEKEEELRLSGASTRTISFQNETPTPLLVEELNVHKGQSVNAGEQLCTLADYSLLFIEGRAFEQDSDAVTKAAENDWSVSAVFPGEKGETIIDDLKLAFVGNAVDPVNRSLAFYVSLPNQMVRDQVSPDGQRFVSWKYRPGQRLQLRVPVEEWKEQIVVPVDAVVKDGADWYVFEQNGDHFDRVPVHVKYRDQRNAVIAYDGSLFPGDVLALKSAHQMQMALKNKSGGAIDPHAGHNH